MIPKIQFSRGNFSTFLSRLSSNIDSPLSPNLIASRAAEKLLRDFGIEVRPEVLMYDDGPLKGEFDTNQLEFLIRTYVRRGNLLGVDVLELFKKFCAELDEECREINLKRAFDYSA